MLKLYLDNFFLNQYKDVIKKYQMINHYDLNIYIYLNKNIKFIIHNCKLV